jgi:hypothetical protein
VGVEIKEGSKKEVAKYMQLTGVRETQDLLEASLQAYMWIIDKIVENPDRQVGVLYVDASGEEVFKALEMPGFVIARAHAHKQNQSNDGEQK